MLQKKKEDCIKSTNTTKKKNAAIIDTNKDRQTRTIINGSSSFENLGWYQTFLVILAASCGISCSFHFGFLPFLIISPDHFKCLHIHNDSSTNVTNETYHEIENETSSYLTLSSEENNWLEGKNFFHLNNSCNGQIIFNPKSMSTLQSTIVTEWSLYDEAPVLWAIIKSSFFLSAAIGAVITGKLSDYFGRKNLLISLNFSQICLGFILAQAWNIQSFIVIRCFLGFATLSANTAASILALELASMKQRALLMIVMGILGDLIRIYGGCLGLLLSDWRWFYTIGTCIEIPAFILSILLLPESPTWLESKGDYEKSEKIRMKIQKISRIGKKLKKDTCKEFQTSFLPTDIMVNSDFAEVTISSTEKKISNSVSSITKEDASKSYHGQFFSLFTTRDMLIKTAELSLIWLAVTIAYWTICMNVNKFLARGLSEAQIVLIFSGAMILFSDWPGMILMNKCGRRLTTSFCLFLTGMSMFLLAFVRSGVAVTAIATIGVTAANLGIWAMIVRTGELYPTAIRSVGCSTCAMLGRIGTVVFPFINLMEVNNESSWSQSLPSLFYAILAISAGLCALHLPETEGIPLPSTIADAKKNPCDFLAPICYWKTTRKRRQDSQKNKKLAVTRHRRHCKNILTEENLESTLMEVKDNENADENSFSTGDEIEESDSSHSERITLMPSRTENNRV